MKSTQTAPNLNKILKKYMFIKNNFNLLLDNKNLSSNKFNVINTVTTTNSINEDFFLPNETDTLFWCFYYIKYGEKPSIHSFKTEKDFKINFIEIIRNNKELIKSNKVKLYDIEDELINSKKISKKTLLVLCKYYEINILLIENNVYYKILGDDSNDIKNIIICDNSNYKTKILTTELFDEYIETKIEAYSYIKIIKGVSAYKLQELKDIANKLNISIVGSNKNKLYEDIMLKLN